MVVGTYRAGGRRQPAVGAQLLRSRFGADVAGGELLATEELMLDRGASTWFTTKASKDRVAPVRKHPAGMTLLSAIGPQPVPEGPPV